MYRASLQYINQDGQDNDEDDDEGVVDRMVKAVGCRQEGLQKAWHGQCRGLHLHKRTTSLLVGWMKPLFLFLSLRPLLSMAYNGDVNRSHRQNDSSSFHGR